MVCPRFSLPCCLSIKLNAPQDRVCWLRQSHFSVRYESYRTEQHWTALQTSTQQTCRYDRLWTLAVVEWCDWFWRCLVADVVTTFIEYVLSNRALHGRSELTGATTAASLNWSSLLPWWPEWANAEHQLTTAVSTNLRRHKMTLISNSRHELSALMATNCQCWLPKHRSPHFANSISHSNTSILLRCHGYLVFVSSGIEL